MDEDDIDFLLSENFFIPRKLDKRFVNEGNLCSKIDAPISYECVLLECFVGGCIEDGELVGMTATWKIRLCKKHLKNFFKIYLRFGMRHAWNYIETQHKFKSKNNDNGKSVNDNKNL